MNFAPCSDNDEIIDRDNEMKRITFSDDGTYCLSYYELDNGWYNCDGKISVYDDSEGKVFKEPALNSNTPVLQGEPYIYRLTLKQINQTLYRFLKEPPKVLCHYWHWAFFRLIRPDKQGCHTDSESSIALLSVSASPLLYNYFHKTVIFPICFYKHLTFKPNILRGDSNPVGYPEDDRILLMAHELVK